MVQKYMPLTSISFEKSPLVEWAVWSDARRFVW